MTMDIFFVLLGCLGTILSVFACALMFESFRRQTQRAWQREQEANKFSYLTERVAELQAEHDALRDALFEARQILGERDLARQELETLKSELTQLDDRRAELVRVDNDLRTLQNDLADASQRKQELDQALHIGELRREELERTHREVTDQVAKLRQEADASQSRCEDIRRHIQTLEKQQQDAERRKEELQKQREQLERTVESLDQERWRKTEEHSREIGQLIANRNSLQDELEQHRKQIDMLKAEREQLDEAVTGLRAERQRLDGALPALRAAFDQMDGRSQHLAQQKRQLESQVESLDQQARRRLDELEELSSRRSAAEDELKQHRRELDALKAEREGLNQSLAGLRAEGTELERSLSILHQDWEQLLTRVGHTADEERTRDLWQPVFERPGYRIVAEADELAQLRELQDHLDRKGFRFHERVLYAFHTALKVNDISPLVVLAGISGTGKSELPRRYAEAMGMHFLNIAVQPRWDSPQDMFGFFNYIEGRYRATELGRALIQMDSFFQEARRGWHPPCDWTEHSLNDQMLLVLLDEMNLARIEYYFSEFLSRLEMRRGIDLSNAVDRRKAEIPLEVGRSGQGASVMHVFVGQNVVFAGTMNEDETTQSLSDKVVDRANVLRFGPPRKLTVDPVQAGVDDDVQPDLVPRLAYDAWRSWRRDPLDHDHGLQPDEREQVQVWLVRLNEVMRLIRRPFAYRVSRAIESYVANFPRIEGKAWLKWAMADQIEQKLLPKFRGLDLSEREVTDALANLQDVVRELDDEPLLQAIQQASRRAEHQFLWQGVQRDFGDE